MNHTPLVLTEKKFYRPRRWTYLPKITDIMISCYSEDDLYEASIDMPVLYGDGMVSPHLQIFTESFAILPLLTAALMTLPYKTTEDDICAALEAVGFRDATGDK